ncbi:MAG: hypothetical protein PHF86_04505 [Candidatus Nanoarchaeia archaeon]|jgi:hypothetical protein|nr:hypothetical protein [Candidatus Nanoarchaeia archaeon]
MLRDTESHFLNDLIISKRGIVKTAVSQLPGDRERVEKTLKKFLGCLDLPVNIVESFLQRVKLDISPSNVNEDFFIILKKMRQENENLHLSTAMTLRRTGLFKVAGRDVYEDLDTGDFWKISEDKKHVVRLFKEDDKGISDKRAAKKQQYSIMGSTPGDGGVVEGESFDDAVATFFEQSGEAGTKADILKEIKKRPGKKISDTEYQYGDYEVKLIKSAGISPTQFEVLEHSANKESGKIKGPGIPDGTGPWGAGVGPVRMRRKRRQNTPGTGLRGGTPACPLYKEDEEKT